jgi:hypothetical protein
MKSVSPLLIIFLVIACTEKKARKDKPADKFFTNAIACTFSEIAYCASPQDSLTKYLPGWNIVWDPEAVKGNYAFVATNGEKYAIAIRGSLLNFSEGAFENWVKQDFNVASQHVWDYADSGIAKISQGAYDAWENLTKLKDKLTNKALWQFIDSVYNSKTELLITGHSLGGNIAITCSSWLFAELKKNGKTTQNIHITTFAAPAPGNAAFAKDYDIKFPDAERIENTHDIVPKFPVADAVSGLSSLYNPAPAASKIEVGFSFLKVKLTYIFLGIKTAIRGFEIANNNSVYTQTKGKQITIPLSGKNIANTAEDFFAEAGYQHGVNQYAIAVGAPVITTH